MADQDVGTEGGAFTQDQLDSAVREALAEAKGEHDTAFKALWDEAKTAKAKAKLFDGLDPNEVRTQLEELQELKQSATAKKKGLTDDQLKQLRQEVREDLEKQYSPFKAQAEQLSAENRELKLDNVVKGLMGKNGVRAARVDALFRLKANEFDLTEDGSPMLKNHPGREVDKYISETLMEEFPEFYESSGSSGGGASKSTGGAGGNVRTIKKGDNAALLANLEGVADGTVQVVD